MSDGSNHPWPGDVLVMVGTRKGTFLFWSDPARRAWRRSHHHGDWSIHAVSYDERSGTIYAATNHNYLNERTVIQRSADGGVAWSEAASGPARCGPAPARPACSARATQAGRGRASQG